MNLTDNLNSKELRLNYNNDGFSRASALRPLIQITFEETTFSKVLFTAATGPASFTVRFSKQDQKDLSRRRL